MTDRPGAPGLAHPPSLPLPEELWRHGAFCVLIRAALGGATDEWFRAHWLSGRERVGYEDGGGNWWELEVLPEGRAVLYGEDHEMSGARWLEPPLDLLAGAPEWLPLKRLRSMDDMLGHVHWFDGASWERIAYPPELRDDGLESTAGRYFTEWRALEEAMRPLGDGLLVEADAGEGSRRAVEALFEAASRRRCTREVLDGLLGDLNRSLEYDDDPPGSLDVEAAFDIALRAGFAPPGG